MMLRQKKSLATPSASTRLRARDCKEIKSILRLPLMGYRYLSNVVHHQPLLHRTKMARDTKILDIRGQSLKLNAAVDVVPLLESFDPTLIEEVHLGGNTIGIEAAREFATFLEKTENLKVLFFSHASSSSP